MSLRHLLTYGTATIKIRWRIAAHIAAWAFNSNPYLKRHLTSNDLDPYCVKSDYKKITLAEFNEQYKQ